MRAVGFDLSRSPWSQYLVTFMSYIFLLYVRAFVLNQVRMCVCCFGHRVWWSNRRKSHFLLEIVFYHEKMRREEIADRWRRPLSCSALLFSSWLLVDGLQDSDDSENAARSKLCALFLTCWWSNAFSCLRFPTFFSNLFSSTSLPSFHPSLLSLFLFVWQYLVGFVSSERPRRKKKSEPGCDWDDDLEFVGFRRRESVSMFVPNSFPLRMMMMHGFSNIHVFFS